MHEPVVSLGALTKCFGEFTAVSGVSLALVRGEVFGLLGPNGAGKTTTLRMLTGIARATSGSATVFGLDCFTQRAEVMRHVGYLPDEPTFYDYLRGREIIRFVGEMHGLDGSAIERVAGPLTSRLGLEGDLEEFAVNYSKGMRKKLALTCALLHEPTVLLLDEPTNGLDPHATRSFLELARERAAAGATVLLSTHLLDQVERICDRAGILSRGRLEALGTVTELRESFAGGGSLEDVFFRVTGGA